jgi:hypothetical protein
MNITTVWIINLGSVALIFIVGWVLPRVTGYGRFYDKMMSAKGNSTLPATMECKAENEEDRTPPK